MNFHIPVLADSVCELLLKPESRLIVDATLGDGGHSLALFMKGGESLKIIGIDRDPEAIARSELRLAAFKHRMQFLNGNFGELAALLAGLGIQQVDGILADLGISSHQVNSSERGFSYLVAGPLRMVMTPDAPNDGYDLVNHYEYERMQAIFFEFGEERFSRKIARAICEERERNPIATTTQLAEIIRRAVSSRQAIKSIARVFQAIRIELNDELGNLEKFLPQALTLLSGGGRLAVISYHSLEDRRVKAFMRARANPCTCPPELAVCVCGQQPEIRLISKRAISPMANEIAHNSRARSAKLRVLEKITTGRVNTRT